MSSLYFSRGAFMMSRRVKFSESKSNVWPVNLAMRSQWRSFIALLDISSNKGQDSLKSSIFCFRSRNACHSFKAFGSRRHLCKKINKNLSTHQKATLLITNIDELSVNLIETFKPSEYLSNLRSEFSHSKSLCFPLHKEVLRFHVSIQSCWSILKGYKMISQRKFYFV